jgi:long-chain acyl-CoA synthetase
MLTPPRFEQETVTEVLLWRLRNDDRAVAYHAEDPAGGFRPVPAAEARRETFALAAALPTLGLERGDRVAILATTRHEWTRCDMANLLAGLVTVGIYPTSTVEQVGYILRHGGCRVLVIEDAAALERVADAVRGSPVEAVYLLDPGATVDVGVPVAPLEELAAVGRQRLDAGGEEAVVAEARKARPDDLLTLVYTSGTTGEPKGAMLTQRNLFHVTDVVTELIGFGPEDRSLVYLPLAHILQRYTLYLGLRAGGQGWYLSDIPRLGEVLEEVQPTILAAVPRVLEKIHAKAMARGEALDARKRRVFHWAFRIGHEVAAATRAGRSVGWWTRVKHRVADRLVFTKIRAKLGGRVRLVVSGGAPLAPYLSEWFHAAGLLVVEGYGLTETSAPATTCTPDAYRFGTVGRPIPRTEIRIDADGEVLIRGPGVFTGYYRDEEATAAALSADGWFRSGDIGDVDADGYLRITDRKKDIIITAGGKNIAPQPLENLLKEHPLVGQAMVWGDQKPYLVALLTLDPDAIPEQAPRFGVEPTLEAMAASPAVRAELDAWVAAVNARVARYETIKRHAVLSVAFVPENGYLTPTLKLKRRIIRQDFGDDIERLYG